MGQRKGLVLRKSFSSVSVIPTLHGSACCCLLKLKELSDLATRCRVHVKLVSRAGLDKLMLELKAKIRRNEERLASEVAPPISLEDKVSEAERHCAARFRLMRYAPIL